MIHTHAAFIDFQFTEDITKVCRRIWIVIPGSAIGGNKRSAMWWVERSMITIRCAVKI